MRKADKAREGQEETDQKTNSSGQYGGHAPSWQGMRRGATAGLGCSGVHAAGPE
jgi:hypothetical protein